MSTLEPKGQRADTPVDPAAVLDEIYLRHRNEDLAEDEQGIAPSWPLWTDQRTPYFQAPGCAIVSRPLAHVRGLGVEDFLRGHSEEFVDYQYGAPQLDPATEVVRFATDYRSLAFDPEQQANQEAGALLQSLTNQGNAAALEHVSFGFLVWGVSRSVADRLARPRAGVAVLRSAASEPIRFVEPLEYQQDRRLHGEFCDRIDRLRSDHEVLVGQREAEPGAIAATLGDHADANAWADEVEASLLITASVRAWRDMFDQWLVPEAKQDIRAAVLRVWLQIWTYAPALLQDYSLHRLQDGSYVVKRSCYSEDNAERNERSTS